MRLSGLPRPGRLGLNRLPPVIAGAGDRAARRFIEFFTATIRNKNTRLAYARAAGRFLDWCHERRFTLELIEPVVVAAYVEQHPGSRPTVKQHLAAIRMLLDWLVTGQVIPMNPAASVRGPKHVVKKGKTPVLTAAEARQLLDHSDATVVVGLRDRALIGLMVYSFARVSAAVGMNVEDYYQQGKRWWLRLHEKGGKRHEVPAHHNAEAYIDAYLTVAGIAGDRKGPLFRTVDRTGLPTANRMSRNDVLRMIKRRAAAAGLPPAICCHSFRATGITAYLENGGTIDVNQPYCLLRQRYSGFGPWRRSPGDQADSPRIVARAAGSAIPLQPVLLLASVSPPATELSSRLVYSESRHD
jgi:site-specific recombinase XerD